MTPTERERIVEAAIQYDNLTSVRSTRIAYIAGATAEHDKARNLAIEIIKELVSSIEEIHENWITPNARYWGSQTNDDVEDAVDKANKFIEQ